MTETNLSVGAGPVSGSILPSSGSDFDVPEELIEFLQPLPILPWEDEASYFRMLKLMASALAPADFLEWCWINDIVALAWTVKRARSAIAINVSLSQLSGIQEIFRQDSCENDPDSSLQRERDWKMTARGIMTGNPGRAQDLKDKRKLHSIPDDAHHHLAFYAAQIRTISLQQMISRANAERDDIVERL